MKRLSLLLLLSNAMNDGARQEAPSHLPSDSPASEFVHIGTSGYESSPTNEPQSAKTEQDLQNAVNSTIADQNSGQEFEGKDSETDKLDKKEIKIDSPDTSPNPTARATNITQGSMSSQESQETRHASQDCMQRSSSQGSRERRDGQRASIERPSSQEVPETRHASQDCMQRSSSQGSRRRDGQRVSGNMQRSSSEGGRESRGDQIEEYEDAMQRSPSQGSRETKSRSHDTGRSHDTATKSQNSLQSRSMSRLFSFAQTKPQGIVIPAKEPTMCERAVDIMNLIDQSSPTFREKRLMNLILTGSDCVYMEDSGLLYPLSLVITSYLTQEGKQKALKIVISHSLVNQSKDIPVHFVSICNARSNYFTNKLIDPRTLSLLFSQGFMLENRGELDLLQKIQIGQTIKAKYVGNANSEPFIRLHADNIIMEKKLPYATGKATKERVYVVSNDSVDMSGSFSEFEVNHLVREEMLRNSIVLSTITQYDKYTIPNIKKALRQQLIMGYEAKCPFLEHALGVITYITNKYSNLTA